MTPSGRSRPVRFAHRAGGDRAPENTLIACEEALRHGAEALEIDVRATADGVPVLMHDETVDRTTDGHGAVADLTLARLKSLDAGSWFAPRYRGEPVATLEEVLDLARGRCGVNVELKIGEGRGPLPSPPPPRLDPGALVRCVVEATARTDFAEPLYLSSFEPRILDRLRSARPGAHLGLICKWTTRGLTALHRRTGLQSVHIHSRLAGRRRLRASRLLGLAVFVWPVREIEMLRRLLALGVDGIMCPDPALFGRAEATDAEAAGPVLRRS